MKRQKEQIGDVFSIALPNGKIAFGQVVRVNVYGFFDCLADSEAEYTIEEIVHRTIIFHALVSASAVSKGRWKILANSSFIQPGAYLFFNNPVGSTRYNISDGKGDLRPSTKEECMGLPVMSVSSAEQMEEQLFYYFFDKETYEKRYDDIFLT